MTTGIEELVLPRLNDRHVHFRQGDMAVAVIPATSVHCVSALVMPNTDPPLTKETVLADYVAFCERAAGPGCRLDFLFMLVPGMTGKDVIGLATVPGTSVVGGKLYPRGITTNSENGFTREDLLAPSGGLAGALGAMEQLGLSLHVHPEMPGSFVLDSEAEFLPFLDLVCRYFPGLRIVVEHVTTADAVAWVENSSINLVAATVTPQHLAWDLGALFDGGLRPHRYCKPVYKTPRDRDRLWQAVAEDRRFMLGSDSAPHQVGRKLANCGCAGVYSAPVLPQVLAHLFGRAGLLRVLPDFVRHRADLWLGRQGVPGEPPIILRREPFRIPDVSPGHGAGGGLKRGGREGSPARGARHRRRWRDVSG